MMNEFKHDPNLMMLHGCTSFSWIDMQIDNCNDMQMRILGTITQIDPRMNTARTDIHVDHVSAS